jgi:hypothetical protein
VPVAPAVLPEDEPLDSGHASVGPDGNEQSGVAGHLQERSTGGQAHPPCQAVAPALGDSIELDDPAPEQGGNVEPYAVFDY